MSFCSGIHPYRHGVEQTEVRTWIPSLRMTYRKLHRDSVPLLASLTSFSQHQKVRVWKMMSAERAQPCSELLVICGRFRRILDASSG